MEKSEIKKKITDILLRMFPGENADPDVIAVADLVDDMGMDSVSFISLILELENAFDFFVPDESLLIDNFRNCSLILKQVEELLMQEEENDEQTEQ